MTQIHITRRVRMAVATAALLFAAGCDSVEDRVASHYERGMELLESDDPDRAVLEFRNALRLDENHAGSRFEIARLYERDGEFQAALGNYRMTAELDAEHVEARLSAARILMMAGALEDAESFVDEALELAPEDAEALGVRAALFLRMGDRADAVRTARAALERDPGHGGAAIVLASERLQASDPDGAVREIDAALARSPDDLSLNLFKLRALEAAGEQEAIGGQLQEMAERFPDRRQFQEALARWRLSQGDVDGAESELRAMVDRFDDADAALLLTRFLLDNRGEDAARRELAARIAATSSPSERATYEIALAELELRAGEDQSAERRLRDLVAALDEEVDEADRLRFGPEARVALARLLMRRDDGAEEAERLAEAVLETDGTNASAALIKGRMLIDAEEPDEAVILLRRALEANPSNVDLMLTLAGAYERSGSRELAADQLATAMSESNFDPDITRRYAAYLRSEGRVEAAETVLAEAARRAPENVAILSDLAAARLALEDWDGVEEVAQAIDDIAAVGAQGAAQLRAQSLRAQGRLRESVALLEDVAADPEGRGAATASLVVAYMQTGEAEKAREILEERLAEAPGDVRANLLSAELFVMEGDLAGAHEALAQVIQSAPDAEVGYNSLARLELIAGDREAAEAALARGIDAVSGDALNLRLFMAQMLEARGAFDEAIEQYEVMYEARPDSLIAANNLASLLAEHRADQPEALARAERVARRFRSSDTPHFQDTYGWIRFLQGDVEESLRHLIPAADALPDNALVRYHAGRALAAANRPSDARMHLEAALAADPSFPKADSAAAALEALRDVEASSGE